MYYKTIDTEYVILENIYDSTENKTVLRQRDLAQIAGTSLGMTNAILRRLVQKGWISTKKLNRRNIQYVVTLEGINEIIHRSYRYFKRTIKNVVYYKDSLEEIISQAFYKNFNTVILVGSSDLDFIIEHVCRHWGMSFSKITKQDFPEGKPPAGTFFIYAENIPAVKYSADNHSHSPIDQQNIFYLSRLIIKNAGRGSSSK